MSRIALSAVVILMTAACAFAQETQPATAPGEVTRLTATVTAVRGKVQVRDNETAPWRDATVGMVVGEDAEFFTNLRSAVQFVIPPDHTITIDRLSTVKIVQAVVDGGVVKTRLGMKQGRTQYEIEAAGREHQSTIATPSATLAVRGTRFIAFDQRPFPAQGVSLQGRVEFRDFKKRTVIGSAAGGRSTVDTETASAAAYARGQTIVDPGIRLARSEGELPLVASLLSSGATVEFDYDKGIRVVRGGEVPQSDNELIPTLPGTLNFVLRWQGNTDLNLGVTQPAADAAGSSTLYPLGGLNVLSSGGEVPFDHVGGPNGGIEVAFWQGGFTEGFYLVASQHMSGPDAPATLDVFRDGQRVPIRTDAGEVTTASFTAQPLPPELGIPAQGIGVVLISPGASSVQAPPAPPAARKATLPRIAGPEKTFKP